MMDMGDLFKGVGTQTVSDCIADSFRNNILNLRVIGSEM